jgi:hypothetical protein
MGVYRSPQTGQPASRAAVPYAIFWVVVIGARAAFSYGAGHWFQGPLVSWAIANQAEGIFRSGDPRQGGVAAGD